jgi:hypothetical protein
VNELEARYAAQLRQFGEQLQALELVVSELSMDDGHPAPGLRIHLEDDAAELLCIYSPLADVEGLEDLDLLNVVLTHADDVVEHRPAAEAVLVAANEVCPLGHFGLRDTGELYYRVGYVTEYGELPELTSFSDSLRLVSYADTVLRPMIARAGRGDDPDTLIAELRA